MLLTAGNYDQGYLVDDELLAGVGRSPERPDQYFAFIIRHTSGEYLGYETYPTLEQALSVLCGIPRPWKFEKLGGGCGGGSCGSKGNCSGTCKL